LSLVSTVMLVKPVSLGLCVSVDSGGVLSYNVGHFANYSTGKCAKETQVSNCSAKLMQGLNRTLLWDPQELNLLESMRIGNMTKKKWTLKQHTNQIQQNQEFLDGLLTSLFGNLPAWFKELIVEGLRICIVLIVVGIIMCICFNCLKKALSRMYLACSKTRKGNCGVLVGREGT